MSFVKDFVNREILGHEQNRFEKRYRADRSLINRIGLMGSLRGHDGCVNTLQWTDDYLYLMSGSDDLSLILWDPFRQKQILNYKTPHEGNIFSVKFMPNTNSHICVSGGADHLIFLHDIEKAESLRSFKFHKERVKRIEVTESCQSTFWSVGEDGIIMETDIRAQESNVLINLADILKGERAAKCVAINQRRPEMIAVGANDHIVRVFDRRKIQGRLFEIDTESSAGRANATELQPKVKNVRDLPAVNTSLETCCKFYLPGYIRPKSNSATSLQNISTTSVAFSSCGTELLTNVGGDHIFLFDIIAPQPLLTNSYSLKKILDIDRVKKKEEEEKSSKSESLGDGIPKTTPELPERLKILKQKANDEYKDGNLNTAIELFNSALVDSRHPLIVSNRMIAYLKRKWRGDSYSAVSDCCEILAKDPSNLKANLMLIRAFLDLKWYKHSCKSIQRFKILCPQHETDSRFTSMLAEISKFVNVDSEIAGDIVAPFWLLDEEPDGPCDHKVCALNGQVCQERICRTSGTDYTKRFVGRRNATTDIKEAMFLGGNDEYIIAGSDEGNFFIWDKKTTNILKIMKGDAHVVNCVQPHITSFTIATSGIDHDVKIWSALPENDKHVENPFEESDYVKTIEKNQALIDRDPLELVVYTRHGLPRRGVRDLGGFGECRTS